MKKRRIGRSALEVSPLALGGNVFGWTVNEKQSFTVLDHFLHEGFNLIDTADYYARWAGVGGESETIIGKWLKARANREQVIIATKVGMDVGHGPSLGKAYILKAVDDSLRRLQTDYIDLYQSHKDDLSTAPEETLEAYDLLIKEGKVRFIGASNFTAARLKESLDISSKKNLPRYESLQPHYNLCERGLFEGELEKICAEQELGVLPYFSLASGFLTGKYRSANDTGKSVRGSGALKYLNKKGLAILQALDGIAAQRNCATASVAIAWLANRPGITAPIASATNIGQLSELLAGALMQLSKEEMNQLNEASST